MKHILNRQGFTLIEVLVGMLLLMIISISVLTLFTHGYMQISRSGSRSKAVFTVQQNIETDNIGVPTQGNLAIRFGVRSITLNINTFRVEVDYGQAGNKASILHFELRN